MTLEMSPRRKLPSAPQRLGHFRDLEPTHFRGFDVGAVTGDAFGELGEAVWIARVEVRIGKRRFIDRDLGA